MKISRLITYCPKCLSFPDNFALEQDNKCTNNHIWSIEWDKHKKYGNLVVKE